MPFGGNDWLALTQEPTLEPEIPISDPHHHFWDLRPLGCPSEDQDNSRRNPNNSRHTAFRFGSSYAMTGTDDIHRSRVQPTIKMLGNAG